MWSVKLPEKRHVFTLLIRRKKKHREEEENLFNWLKWKTFTRRLYTTSPHFYRLSFSVSVAFPCFFFINVFLLLFLFFFFGYFFFFPHSFTELFVTIFKILTNFSFFCCSSLNFVLFLLKLFNSIHLSEFSYLIWMSMN